MLTAAVRDLHLSYPNQFITDVRTSCPQLWENNPYITQLSDNEQDAIVLDCHYPLIHQSNKAPYHFVHGFTHFLNERFNLQIRPALFKGDIHLSNAEKALPSQIKEMTGQDFPFWIVVAGGKKDYTIKWWSSERYQKVVDRFIGKIQFVQVGEKGHHHPLIKGAIDLRGRTDLRQLVNLAYHSQGILCPVTFAMHLAAAVEMKQERPKNRPCVVIAGGREPVQWEAYPQHQFLHTAGALLCCDNGGCWKSRTFPLGDGDKKDQKENLCVDVVGKLPHCMHLVTAERVIQSIETYYEGGSLRYLTSSEATAAEAARRHEMPPLVFTEKPLDSVPPPPVTICVLAFGDYPNLISRCLNSIRDNCERSQYRLIVGMNAVCKETEQLLESWLASGDIDFLCSAPRNINKCPMMRRMFERVNTEFIWWFDDDSYITAKDALPRLIDIVKGAPSGDVMWGRQYFFGNERDFGGGADIETFIKTASWYQNMPPPSWKPGGKGESNFKGRGTGDGRWFFLTGGSWVIRTATIRALDWPDRRLMKRADDVFLAEAIRQQKWKMREIPFGVAI